MAGGKYEKLLVILIAIFFIIFIPVSIFIISKSSEKKSIVSPLIEFVSQIQENPLRDIFENNFQKNSSDYAVVIKNLKTGESFFYNENKKFNSASLYKLWVMAVAFDKISKNTLSENETLIGDLNKIDEVLEIASPSGTPVPSPTPREIKMVTSDAIEKMITVSDNYAAILVASRSGSANIFSFLKNNGFLNSSYKMPPTTTAKDVTLFFEKLYRREIINDEYSEKMITLLKNQTLNDRLPKYLPQNLEIAHKTGELGGFKHDAGIVFAENGDYIIVVLSKTEDQDAASEKIANFSKGIYQYFIGKN